MWLDRGEFEGITDYMTHERAHAQVKQIEKQLATDVKRVVTGGPESRIDELRDAKSAVSALISATIFEHPALFNLVTSIPRL
jgi:hypothetical protein